MTHAGEAAVRESRLDRTSRAQHEGVADPHEDDLASDQRLLEATTHDVQVGPLRH
jgi:hypothetical protein